MQVFGDMLNIVINLLARDVNWYGFVFSYFDVILFAMILPIFILLLKGIFD